jgi:hypothetical protein
MSNIPGTNAPLPGAYTDILTASGSISVPGGARVSALIGEGSTNETIVSQANGGGNDGLNPSYTSSIGSDGRHFVLKALPITTALPLASNRTSLYRNGVLLSGIEGTITTTSTIPVIYDYAINISNGQIELQSAHFVDQGSGSYTALTTNTGVGSLSNLTLVDANAPQETWTVRCVGVQRNVSNLPIAGTAQFMAFGSISGSPVDANGNPIVWVADGYIVSNGILSFSILENASYPFVQGDGFTIVIASGVLNRGDSLTANYIATSGINSPTVTNGMNDVINRFGTPGLVATPGLGLGNSNALSLGAQLFYAQSAPSMIAVQAMPPLPRRTSFELSTSVNAFSSANQNYDDFIFPLPVGVHPGISLSGEDSDIHFFIQSGGVETQILPNQYPYYTLQNVDGETAPAGAVTLANFISETGVPAFSYSVVYGYGEDYTASDGYLLRNSSSYINGIFTSASKVFTQYYVGKILQIVDAVNTANIGYYSVTSVSNGQLYVTYLGTAYNSTNNQFPAFLTEISGSNIAFQVINSTTLANLPVASGTDGYVTPTTGYQATFTSPGTNFSSITNISSYKLQINGTSGSGGIPNDNGLYDIIAVNGHSLTITKTIVTEGLGNQFDGYAQNGINFMMLNPSASVSTSYVVISKSVVPPGDGLRVTLVDQRDFSFYDAGWEAALASLQVVECDIVVPLPSQTISVIFQNTVSHCIEMSNIVNRKERVAIIGAINGLSPANLLGTPVAVEAIGELENINDPSPTNILNANLADLVNYSVSAAYGETYRCIYCAPDQILVQAGANIITIDGFYQAAAVAGYLVADVQRQNPLTNKVMSGYTIQNSRLYTTTTIQQLAAAGVTVLQPVSGGGLVIWGVTTSQSGYLEEKEVSIVFIRDYLAKLLRAGFQEYAGTPQTANTAAILSTRATDLLNSFVAENLITTYTGLSVVQDDVDPTQWDISVSVSPTYPINFIYIKVTVGNLTPST